MLKKFLNKTHGAATPRPQATPCALTPSEHNELSSMMFTSFDAAHRFDELKETAEMVGENIENETV